MNLEDVQEAPDACAVLYDLLKERTPEVSISHKQMPSWQQHVEFVCSKPYLDWQLIVNHDTIHGRQVVGAVYLTKARELGVFIFERYRKMGYGEAAIRIMMNRHRGGRFLANIAPGNVASVHFFRKLGFNLIQTTYSLEK
jgi:RimJ/RimL family protein N-acetyltransferase